MCSLLQLLLIVPLLKVIEPLPQISVNTLWTGKFFLGSEQKFGLNAINISG